MIIGSFVFFTGLVAILTYLLTRQDDHESSKGYFLGGRKLGGVVIARSVDRVFRCGDGGRDPELVQLSVECVRHAVQPGRVQEYRQQGRLRGAGGEIRKDLWLDLRDCGHDHRTPAGQCAQHLAAEVSKYDAPCPA